MSNPGPGEVTELLRHCREPEIRGRLFEIIYPELHQIAAYRMSRERKDHTLQPTALVNELFLRMASRDDLLWRSREHFLAIASAAMRRLLLDHARASGAAKRGGAETLRHHTFLRHAATSYEFQARLEAARAGARPRGLEGQEGGNKNGQPERSWKKGGGGGEGLLIDNQRGDVQERKGLQCHVQLGASRADSRAGSGVDTVPPSPSELCNGGTRP